MNSLDRVLKKHEKTIKRKNANLDEISNDIKKVELFLTNSGMKHPFIMEIPFTNEELFLEWDFWEKQKIFRLCLSKKIDDVSFRRKPLIECSSKDRQQIHSFLEEFIKRFMALFKEYFKPMSDV